MGCVGSRVDVEADGRQFHLKRLIASGGFSQIYSAEDLESGERVAIKRICCHSNVEIERTYREIEVHRRFGCSLTKFDDENAFSGDFESGDCNGEEFTTSKPHDSSHAGDVEDSNRNGILNRHNGKKRGMNRNPDLNGNSKKNSKSVQDQRVPHLYKAENGGAILSDPKVADSHRQSRFIMPIFAVGEERISAPPTQTVVSFSLIFPLCKLGSLQDELATRRQSGNYISSLRIVRLFRQVCCALVVLHNSRPPIAHRDLKPANLLLRSPDHVLLTDFGSAMECPIAIGDARQRRAVLDAAAEFCTMPYRAPELFTCETGTQLDESVDIWSLGCVLYALCYFVSPFDAVYERGDSVALAVQSARLDFDEHAPIDESLKSLIRDLVRFEPKERPRIAEILKRLDACSY